MIPPEIKLRDDQYIFNKTVNIDNSIIIRFVIIDSNAADYFCKDSYCYQQNKGPVHPAHALKTYQPRYPGK
jgi:hypothetical protein